MPNTHVTQDLARQRTLLDDGYSLDVAVTGSYAVTLDDDLTVVMDATCETASLRVQGPWDGDQQDVSLDNLPRDVLAAIVKAGSAALDAWPAPLDSAPETAALGACATCSKSIEEHTHDVTHTFTLDAGDDGGRQLTGDEVREARGWLVDAGIVFAGEFDAARAGALSPLQVEHLVERHYTGGIAEFIKSSALR